MCLGVCYRLLVGYSFVDFGFCESAYFPRVGWLVGGVIVGVLFRRHGKHGSRFPFLSSGTVTLLLLLTTAVRIVLFLNVFSSVFLFL